MNQPGGLQRDLPVPVPTGVRFLLPADSRARILGMIHSPDRDSVSVDWRVGDERGQLLVFPATTSTDTSWDALAPAALANGFNTGVTEPPDFAAFHALLERSFHRSEWRPGQIEVDGQAVTGSQCTTAEGIVCFFGQHAGHVISAGASGLSDGILRLRSVIA